MSGPSINFMSYNSTGLNTLKTDWIRSLIKSCNIKFMQVQEHFLWSKGADSLAFLSQSLLDVGQQRLPTISWRLQAEVLHFGQYRLLWINCYFPCDTRQQEFDDTEVRGVMREIETILDSGGYDDVICGGDFNFDDRRDTGFTRLVRGFFSYQYGLNLTLTILMSILIRRASQL